MWEYNQIAYFNENLNLVTLNYPTYDRDLVRALQTCKTIFYLKNILFIVILSFQITQKTKEN